MNSLKVNSPHISYSLSFLPHTILFNFYFNLISCADGLFIVMKLPKWFGKQSAVLWRVRWERVNAFMRAYFVNYFISAAESWWWFIALLLLMVSSFFGRHQQPSNKTFSRTPMQFIITMKSDFHVRYHCTADGNNIMELFSSEVQLFRFLNTMSGYLKFQFPVLPTSKKKFKENMMKAKWTT